MSLEELLKDSEGASPWRPQRKTLLRIVLGIAIVAVAIVIGTILLFSIKNNKNSDDLNAESLAQLIRIRQETAELQEDLSKMRQTASVAIENKFHAAKQNGRVRRLSSQSSATFAPTTQVISVDPGEGFLEIHKQTNEIYIPTGSVFQARLVTPIKTSVERTFVMAETTSEFRMDMERRIPKGSRLIGRSRLNPILKGVIVEFDTLVLPNGLETNLSAMALSRNALPEIDGLYFSDSLETYGTALAFGFLSGFADAGRRREVTAIGTQVEESLSNQVLAGLSTAAFQVAEDILSDIRTSAVEYVVVPAGEPIFVALTRRYNITQGSPVK